MRNVKKMRGKEKDDRKEKTKRGRLGTGRNNTGVGMGLGREGKCPLLLGDDIRSSTM